MAPRLATAEEMLLGRLNRPEVEDYDSVKTLIAPIEVLTQLRAVGIPNNDSGLIAENQLTNPQRIKFIEDLSAVDPQSGEQLRGALDELPKVGDLFKGFRLVEVLGEGAFGTVFRAEQLGMANRAVALKISADLLGERQSLAQLQHTHIMPIYSYHSSGEVQAICMPFYGRTTLADWCRELRNSSALPTSAKMIVSTLQNRQATIHSSKLHSDHAPSTHPATEKSNAGSNFASRTTGPRDTNPGIEKMEYVDAVLWLGSCIADGLFHAHERGIIHRDLKPANVLLTDEGVPMVLDFNLSEDVKIREAELMVRVGGTLPYMSPEQLEVFQGGSRELDGRTDVYSLGLILFQLLTGHHPFPMPKGTPSETIERMLRDRRKSPPLLAPHNPAVSPAIESIVRRCLHADPTQRYSDARQLREDLERHRAHQPLKYAPNPSIGELLLKWTRRHNWVTSKVTIGLLCSVGMLAGANSWLWHRDHLKQEEVREMTMQSKQLFQGVSEQLRQGRMLLLDWAATPEKLREGSELLGRAIDQYDAKRNPDWFSQRQVQILPAEDQSRIREQIEESKQLVARAKKLIDPSRPEIQAMLAKRTPEQIRNLLESKQASAKNGDETKVPELKDSERRTAIADLMSSGHYREAVPYLRQSLAKQANDFEAWFQLGCCFKMLGENRDGVHAFTAALASKPNWIDALWNRSQLHEALNDSRSALLDLESILKLDGKHFEALLQRAVMLCRLDRFEEALKQLEPAMELPNVPTRIWFIRAEIRDSLKDREGAASDRAHGMELEPNEIQSWNCRGYLRMKTEPEKALSDFQQAEKLDPRSIHSLQNQANLYGEVWNKPAEALAAIDRILENHPQYLPAVANRGVYLARLGQVENAVNQAKASLALSDSPYSHFRAACVFARVSAMEVKYKQDAISHLAKALMQGYGYNMLVNVSDLDPIRGDLGFKNLAGFAVLMKSMQK